MRGGEQQNLGCIGEIGEKGKKEMLIHKSDSNEGGASEGLISNEKLERQKEVVRFDTFENWDQNVDCNMSGRLERKKEQKEL